MREVRAAERVRPTCALQMLEIATRRRPLLTTVRRRFHDVHQYQPVVGFVLLGAFFVGNGYGEIRSSNDLSPFNSGQSDEFVPNSRLCIPGNDMPSCACNGLPERPAEGICHLEAHFGMHTVLGVPRPSGIRQRRLRGRRGRAALQAGWCLVIPSALLAS